MVPRSSFNITRFHCNNNNWFLYSAFPINSYDQSASQCIITPVIGFRNNSALSPLPGEHSGQSPFYRRAQCHLYHNTIRILPGPHLAPGSRAAMWIECLAEGQKYRAKVGFEPGLSVWQSSGHTTIPRHLHGARIIRIEGGRRNIRRRRRRSIWHPSHPPPPPKGRYSISRRQPQILKITQTDYLTSLVDLFSGPTVTGLHNNKKNDTIWFHLLFLFLLTDAKDKLRKWREENTRNSMETVDLGEFLLTNHRRKLGDEGMCVQ